MTNFAFYIHRYLTYCTVNKQLSPCTLQRYRRDLERFAVFLENLDPPVLTWAQVKRKHLDNYLDAISDRYEVTTIKSLFSSLRLFFYFLEDDGLDLENPFKRFRLHLQTPSKIPCSLTLREAEAILMQAYQEENPDYLHKLRDLLILELLFFGGMRVAELCGITLSRYDPAERTIEVLGKGGKDRFIFLTNMEVITLLQDYLALRNALKPAHDFLLLSDTLSPLKPNQVRRLIHKCTLAAGITKKVTPHTFRHTFASLLLEEGVDIKYIQEFLGHSTITTTQIYLHTTAEKKRMLLETKHPREKLHFSLNSE